MPRPADSASPAPGTSAVVASPLHPWAVRSALIVALAALAALSFVYPSASRIHTWPLALVNVAWWLTPVVALGFTLQRCSAWRTPSLPLLAGCLLLAVGAVLSAALSPFASVSLPRLWPTLGGVALYLWLHHTWSANDSTHTTRLDRVGRWLAWAGVLFAAVSLSQWSQGTWPLPWGGRNDRPFGHSTYTAGAAVLVLPWLALQVWRSRGPGRLGWLLGGGGVLVVLISTSSRGGVLALAGLGFVAVVVASVQARWTRRRKLLFAVLLLAVGATVILTNPRLRELVLQRQWSELARESNAQRQAMFDAGLRLGAARPMLGWGPGSVPLAYPRVRAQLDGGTENILQLHNTPVQIWATTGGVGVVAMLLLVVGTLAAIVRTARTPAALAAAASLAGYGLVALTDHQLDLPFFAGLVAISLAILTASARTSVRRVSPSPVIRYSSGLLLLVVMILAGGTSMRDLQARRHYDAALTALGAGQSTEYLQALDRATRSQPGDPFFQHQAVAYLLDLRTTVPGAAEQAALTRDAMSRLKRSLVSGVHQEFAHFNLGWLDLELDQPRDAARHFTAAARLVPDKGGVYFGLGLAHLAAGNREAALRAFALEALNDPRSLTSPAWELPRLASLQAEVRAEIIRLYAGLQPSHPAAATVAAWTRWWWGEAVSVDQMRPGFSAASARFLDALPTINALAPAPADDAPWQRAYAAWRSSREAGSAAATDAFLRAASGDSTFAAALARRAQRHRDTFRAFLTAPTEDEPALVRTLRHRRPGYGMLALHPEGPPLHDAYTVQENRAITELAAGLFPVKGWLPGRFLLALLPESPR